MRRRVCHVAVVTICLLSCCLSGCSSKASAQPVSGPEAPLITEGKGLFRSHEFRSTLKALPGWLRVMESASRTSERYMHCDPAVDTCSAAALSWQKIVRQAQNQTAMEQLRQVNRYFNRWPYRLDQDVYGVSDYWATPEEFLHLSGDCEDYSIAKYYALRELGFPDQSLRIVLLKDTIRNIAHAVLAVELDNERYILDNMSDLVLSHLQYEHYVPQYSVNESYRWAHIAPGTIY
ncbi:MAG: transglutaminase-like cysteine peptidase [Desulfuromonadales bacterium]|nr:transglutaminase-like cysteine peptidase [Desulfuromonadales bacterium]